MKSFTISVLFFLSPFFVLSQAHLGYVKETSLLQDSTHKTIHNLQKGELLYVFDPKLSNGTYKVAYLKTSKIGFVKADDIKLERTIHAESTVESIRTEEREPWLKAHNNSRIPMTLKIAKTKYLLAPHQVLKIRVKKGKFKYYVSSSASEYHYGEELLDDYHLYDWEFYVDDVK